MTCSSKGQPRHFLVVLVVLSIASVAEGALSSISLNDTPYYIVKTDGEERAQGSSLKGLIEAYFKEVRVFKRKKLSQRCKPIHSTASQWEEYLDAKSGDYYYHNPVSDETQWEDPLEACGDLKSVKVPSIERPALLYNDFNFLGHFDHLVAVTNRARFKPLGYNPVVVDALEEMANTDIETMHRVLEVAIANAEKEFRGDQWLARTMGRPDSDEDLIKRGGLAAAWNDLASIWFAKGEIGMSLDCFRKSVLFNDQDVGHVDNFAGALEKLGFHDDAAAVAASLHPSFAQDFRAYKGVGRGNDAAIHEWLAGSALLPPGGAGGSDSRGWMHWLYMNQGVLQALVASFCLSLLLMLLLAPAEASAPRKSRRGSGAGGRRGGLSGTGGGKKKRGRRG